MNLPPHIQNAPTPRTDEAVIAWNQETGEPYCHKLSVQRIERELIYAREVMEKMAECLRPPETVINCDCSMCKSFSTYEQFKKDTEV